VPETRARFAALTVEENLSTSGFTCTRASAPKPSSNLRAFPAHQGAAVEISGYLSGSEQQMVAVGRPLMGRPRVLMLDEPSLGSLSLS
jgi:branched-chain amino acid transport system ATP-binding protein